MNSNKRTLQDQKESLAADNCLFRNAIPRLRKSAHKKSRSAELANVPHPTQLQTITGTSAVVQCEQSDSSRLEHPILVCGDGDKPSSRDELRIESAFESAVEALRQAMCKVSGGSWTSESFSLENFQEIDDMVTLARNVEAEVENFIREKALKVASTSKEKWKKCVKNWFMAAFPPLQTAVNIAGVSNL